VVFHHGGGFGLLPFGLFSMLSGLLLLVGLVVLIVWAVRTVSGPPGWRVAGPMGPPAPQPGTPLDILARRFAAGEISADDYRRMRDVLHERPGQEPPKT
jgi:putative membrane protein